VRPDSTGEELEALTDIIVATLNAQRLVTTGSGSGDGAVTRTQGVQGEPRMTDQAPEAPEKLFWGTRPDSTDEAIHEMAKNAAKALIAQRDRHGAEESAQSPSERARNDHEREAGQS
jgi:hypothetical protein